MGFDVDRLIERAFKAELIETEAISLMCSKLKDIFLEEDNVQRISAPVTVVGDIHGQFYDLLEIFKVGGQLPYTSYLFLGDYVDRGAHSVEVITLLCLLKIKYPTRISMIRGNHETRGITQNYGFYMQCQTKYNNTTVWECFTDIFDYIPIAASINHTIFAVHGGLSPAIETVDQIEALDRFMEIPHDGPLCDLMWSDPAEQKDATGFAVSPRGAGYIFGEEVLQKFLFLNGFNHLTRAHQLCNEGYQLLFKDQLSTVWSAPNYLYRFQNLASVMQVDEHCNKSFNIFSDSPDNLAKGVSGMDKSMKGETQKYFM